MLSGILRSETAISANIRIMRAFADMRKMLPQLGEIGNRVGLLEYSHLQMKQQLTENSDKIELLMSKINSNKLDGYKQGIFFDGQIYDAYAFVAGLVRKAERRIVLIDNYIDDTVLTLLDKRAEGVEAAVYTGKISQQLQLDIEKHNAQYSPVEVRTFAKAHDRFLIVDDEVYLIGASIKDLGKKWFGFTLMENTSAEELLGKIS